MARLRRRKDVPVIDPRFWRRGQEMYGVELYVQVRLAVVDEGPWQERALMLPIRDYRPR